MIVQLGYTTSSNITVNKNFTIAQTVNVNTIKPIDVMNPVLILQTPNPLKYNYAYIETYGRYYYITNYQMKNQNQILISLHVDVLNSFKNEIKSNRAIIARQQNDYNLYLNDNTFKLYQNPITDQIKCSGGFDGEQSLILLVSGGNDAPITPPDPPTIPIQPGGGGGGGIGGNDNPQTIDRSKFYINRSYGGYNPCIIRNNKTGSVLPNCVGYAYGRFQEMSNITTYVPHLPACNAVDWFNRARPYFETGQTPRVGAVACWGGGYGHVAIVESVEPNRVVMSMSEYSGRKFAWQEFNSTTNFNYWGKPFIGFIYNPYLSNYTYTPPQPSRSARPNPTKPDPARPSPDPARPNPTKPDQAPAVSVEVVGDVLRGKYGNGVERRKKLESEGYIYKEVQKEVNKYCQCAHDVWLGKYGNGEERRKKLESDGYDYKLVQMVVNMLK